MPRLDLIQCRRGDAAEWAAVNPILDEGELGGELDTGQVKIGDGTTLWLDLPYVGGGLTGGGGGGGAGTVVSVNDIGPDGAGNISLDASDVGADAAGAAAAAVTGHTNASDPHPQYLTASEGGAAYDALGAATQAVNNHVFAPDPHPQYLTTSEGNTAYDALGAGASAASAAVTAHTDATDPHPQYTTSSEATSAAQAAAAAAITTHTDAPDPHPQYKTTSEAGALYEPLGGGGGGGGGPATPGEATWRVATPGAAQTLPSLLTYGVARYALNADLTLTTPATGGLDTAKTYSQLIKLVQPESGGTYDYGLSWAGDPITWLDGNTPPIPAQGPGAETYITLVVDGANGDISGSASVPNRGNQAVTLSIDGSGHVAIPADQGDIFNLTLTRNVILDAPTGLTPDKALLLRLFQDATGGWTIDWSDPIWNFGTDVPEPFLTVTGLTHDYALLIQTPQTSKVDVLSTSRGY